MQRHANFLILAIILAGAFRLAGCCPSCVVEEAYTVPEAVPYHCEGFGTVAARYYSRGDDDRRYVRLILPDGAEHTLPQALSASGARYTDDHTLLWWIKGDRAILQVRDEAGAWQTISDNCRVEAGRE